MDLFRKKKIKPIYLERIDEFEYVRIARLKGDIDRNIVPEIEARIQDNRKQEGVVIDKNIIIDYSKVERVDSAAIAFNIVRLKEAEVYGKQLGFIHVPAQLKIMLNMFKQGNTFQIFDSEESALNELNQK